MEKKDRLRKLYQEALDLSFSGYTITEYNEVPTYKLDENTSWVSDSKAIFITCKYEAHPHHLQLSNKISEHLENLFGFECSVHQN
jgi:hypothetical protein